MQKKMKRILAWIAIIILVGIYLATFILGVFGSTHTADLFKACIALTIVVPVLFYAILLVAKILSGDSSQQKDEHH